MNDEPGQPGDEAGEGAPDPVDPAEREQALEHHQEPGRRILVAAAYPAFGEDWRWCFWQADDEGPEVLREAVMDFLRVEAQWFLEDRGEKFEAWPSELELNLYAVDPDSGEMDLWISGEAPECLAILDGEGSEEERGWAVEQLTGE